MDIDTFSEVEWCQWERVEQMTTSKKEKTKKRSKTMTKICKLGTVDEVIQTLEDQMPYFLQHVYVKRQRRLSGIILPPHMVKELLTELKEP